MIGWEGAEPRAADLTAADVPEPAADASIDAKTLAYLKRFHHRAADVSLTYAEGADRSPDIRRCADELEKLHALRPELGVPTMNLHWAAARLKDEKRAQQLVDDFVRTGAREPQAVAYFARELNNAGKYAEAVKLLARAAPLNDYLGDEIGVERMRAFAGQKDVKGAVGAFDQRVQKELTADLDQFHFAYHVAVAMGMPSGEMRNLWDKHSEALLAEFKTRAEAAGARMVYPVSLVGFYSRLKRTDDEIDVLLAALTQFETAFGFQHFFYRSVFRIIEAGGPATPD